MTDSDPTAEVAALREENQRLREENKSLRNKLTGFLQLMTGAIRTVERQVEGWKKIADGLGVGGDSYYRTRQIEGIHILGILYGNLPAMTLVLRTWDALRRGDPPPAGLGLYIPGDPLTLAEAVLFLEVFDQKEIPSSVLLEKAKGSPHANPALIDKALEMLLLTGVLAKTPSGSVKIGPKCRTPELGKM